ncbi:MAG: hypothetical protein JW746_07425 [Candidatus Krumholzibacteriota bacterium]|nr:hypothetical protein [Candidatus Krumholzibacteriota bacterium]
MQALNIKPSINYLKKLRLILTIVAFLVVIVGFAFSRLIGIDEGAEVASIVFIIFLIVDFLWWIPSMVLAGYYFRSLNYEIQDDEVIVRVGIVTKW